MGDVPLYGQRVKRHKTSKGVLHHNLVLTSANLCRSLQCDLRGQEEPKNVTRSRSTSYSSEVFESSASIWVSKRGNSTGLVW